MMVHSDILCIAPTVIRGTHGWLHRKLCRILHFMNERGKSEELTFNSMLLAINFNWASLFDNLSGVLLQCDFLKPFIHLSVFLYYSTTCPGTLLSLLYVAQYGQSSYLPKVCVYDI